ncbi:uncharacterized protein MEPE_03951 [Melanopsichium pennsylvanicum]|uniref:Uncharacterized protein n=2 Tax=Melanopsichium pennsylvanicum TaxID=63383 RepID=A0AAJ4XNY0_9BASI|nr:uncharacterized protein BN887_00269 [Melanopsichium pennsylvanicum 4]SNX85242.1 uncharacterized protein MEPE_03951 [Melanopsichium pennsylvanicum]
MKSIGLQIAMLIALTSLIFAHPLPSDDRTATPANAAAGQTSVPPNTDKDSAAPPRRRVTFYLPEESQTSAVSVRTAAEPPIPLPKIRIATGEPDRPWLPTREPKDVEPKTWSSWFKSKLLTFRHRPPSSDREMARLIQRRPPIIRHTRQALAMTRDLPIAGDKEILTLIGGSNDARALALMTHSRKAFFVKGGNGKLWHFSPKNRNSYTWTEVTNQVDLNAVSRATRDSTSMKSGITREATVTAGTAATSDRLWWKKMARGARGLFTSASASSSTSLRNL